MKAALYLRVSTIEQSTENQLPDLEALASRRGFDIVRISSESVSAVKTRPEYDAMIAAAHRGKLDVLLVWSRDRLAAEHGRGVSPSRASSRRRGGGGSILIVEACRSCATGAVARPGRSGAELAVAIDGWSRRARAASDGRPPFPQREQGRRGRARTRAE
jgi:hypothetical protein